MTIYSHISHFGHTNARVRDGGESLRLLRVTGVVSENKVMSEADGVERPEYEVVDICLVFQ